MMSFTLTVYKLMPRGNDYSSLHSHIALYALSHGVVPMSGTIVVEDDGTA